MATGSNNFTSDKSRLAARAKAADLSSTTQDSVVKISDTNGTFAKSGVTIDSSNNISANSFIIPTNNNAIAHLSFNRDGRNYINFPNGSSAALSFVSGSTLNDDSTLLRLESSGQLLTNGPIVVNAQDGTTSAVGISRIKIGNSTASGTNKNSKGSIWLYSSGSNYYAITGNDSNTLTGNVNVYLPRAASGSTYLVYTSGTSAVGDSTTPVYVDGNGKITSCSGIGGSAYHDSDYYLPVSSPVTSGNLTIQNAGSRYKKLVFRHKGGADVGEIYCDTGDVTTVESSRINFVEYSANSPNNTTTTGYYERYRLPRATAGLSESVDYTILTTKNYDYSASTPENVGTTNAVGTATNFSRGDHKHAIALATGSTNGTVSIAGTDVAVKGLDSAAYKADTYFAVAGHNHDDTYLKLTGGSLTGNVDITVSGTGSSNYRKFTVANGSGSVSLYAAGNRGIYDNTAARWLVYAIGSTGDVCIPDWCAADASIGGTTTPVYFYNGKPTVCSSFAESSHNHDDTYLKKTSDTMTGNLTLKHATIDKADTDLNVTGNTYRYLYFNDKSGETLAYMRVRAQTSGTVALQINVQNLKTDGTSSVTGPLITMSVPKSGTSRTIGITNTETVNMSSSDVTTKTVTNAIWNDYAEYRKTNTEVKYGQCVVDCDDGSLAITNQRLMPGAQIVSDTWGHCMGMTEEAQTPVAVAGRVLAYTYKNRNEYHAGMCVCSAPNGTVDIMTREEIIQNPDAIIGIVSEIPNYEIWGTGNVKVNNRIWIKVR